MVVRAGTDAHKKCYLCFSSKRIHTIMSNDVNTVDNLAGINNLICIAKVIFFQLLQKDAGQSRLSPKEM